MRRNSHYFVDKDMRAKQARIHTERMDKEYYSEICESIRYSICYTGVDDTGFTRRKIEPMTPSNGETTIELVDMGSIEAIFKYAKEAVNPGILNFASYTNPGGMFMKGSSAQEECLCHASYLYNVLSSSKLHDYYSWNFSHKNRGMYLDRAIYTPRVRFFDYTNQGKDGQFDTTTCNVVTCAAPNWSVALKYGNFSKDENSVMLTSRIDMVLRVMSNYYMDTIILGAFGCGVFAQDAIEVATIFKKLLDTKYKNVFKRVIFAVPNSGKSADNYAKFNWVFNREG